jgi:hypothetical protein
MIYDICEDAIARLFSLSLRVPANVILEIRYDIRYRLFIILGKQRAKNQGSIKRRSRECKFMDFQASKRKDSGSLLCLT